MAVPQHIPLKLNEQKTIFNKVAESGAGEEYFYIVSGSRMLMTLSVTAIDPGTVITAFIEDTFSTDDDYQGVMSASLNGVGVTKRVANDLNQLIKVRYLITGGGNVTFKTSVILYDNASTTRIENAQLSVDIDAKPDSTGHYDSIRIGDGVEELQINPDGSINVNVDIAGDEEPANPYGEALGVASGVETTVLLYTVPAGKIGLLYRAESAGENIAKHQVTVNGDAIATKRTYFGGDLNTTFDFSTPVKRSIVLEAGDIIEVKIIHNRPDAGDFEARLQLLLKDAA